VRILSPKGGIYQIFLLNRLINAEKRDYLFKVTQALNGKPTGEFL
jgi:hypothetical protein